MKMPYKLTALFMALGSTALLSGCFHDDDNPPVPREFSVEVSNLTNHQPFAPVGVVLHEVGYHPYTLGAAASTALETMAEGGDVSDLISEADSHAMTLDTMTGTGIIAPGSNETITVQSVNTQPRLSLVGMLVNTNDGFIGLNGVDVSGLGLNESLDLKARVYDAGTEANSEAAADVPGQGGEGFNASRNDRDFVAVHPGVISMDDGLSGSSLDQSHRFDNPSARIVVTRTR
jgi:hypothetical protein